MYIYIYLQYVRARIDIEFALSCLLLRAYFGSVPKMSPAPPWFELHWSRDGCAECIGDVAAVLPHALHLDA